MTDKQVDKFIKDAINKQFIIAKHKVRFEACFKIKDWYSKFTMTKKQHAEWKKWFLENFKKKFSYCTLKSAKKEFVWFDLMYGLRIEG